MEYNNAAVVLELMEEQIQEHMVVKQLLESLCKEQQRAKKKQVVMVVAHQFGILRRIWDAPQP
jgi:hypothetical protein